MATAAKPVGYEWPKRRGLPIVGTFGKPPIGKKPQYSLISGSTGKQILTQAARGWSNRSLSLFSCRRLADRHHARRVARINRHREAPRREAQAAGPGPEPRGAPSLRTTLRLFNSHHLTPRASQYLALGLANFFGSFFGGYPVAGSFSRSALNDDVGATSPMAVLVVAVAVGVVLKIATVAPIFFYLPQTALSAIVSACCTSARHLLSPLTQVFDQIQLCPSPRCLTSSASSGCSNTTARTPPCGSPPSWACSSRASRSGS